MVKNSEYFTTHSFTRAQALEKGAKRAKQRFEQCLEFLELNMRPALDALSSVEFYDQAVQKSATELVEMTVSDAVEYISQIETVDQEIRISIIDKLKSAKLWVMFPDNILNLTKIDRLYSELDFKGPESLIELSLKIQLHTWKLQLKPQQSWIRILHTIINEFSPSYFPDENILSEYEHVFLSSNNQLCLCADIPVRWTLYPFFHPNRSRFFNMATLYHTTVESINTYLTKMLPSEDQSDFLPVEELIYKSYAKWEANGGVDLQLPSFKLTNRQMLWVCLVHTFSKKYHRNTPKNLDQIVRIVIDNLHIYTKHIPEFREAFQCGNLTNDEQKQFEEYKEIFNHILD